MLTRELLRYRVRNGQVTPLFVDAAAAELQDTAAQLVACVEAHRGQPRAALEAALAAIGGGCPLRRGLAKLLLDGCEFAPPDPEAVPRRLALWGAAAALWRTAGDAADLPARLAALRPPELHDDLPPRRPLVAAASVEPVGLLQRYNVALVQGLAQAAARLTVVTDEDDPARLRRLLRWLKFCRLVAEVRREGDGLTLVLSGPAAELAHARAYGMALAQFVLELPLLRRFRLSAAVTLRRGPPVTLELDERAPLVRLHRGAAGHVPPEMARLGTAMAGHGWQLEPALPRPIGVADMLVPDLRLRHDDGLVVDVELFHRWHAGPLDRRLAQLALAPEPRLVLGIERRLRRPLPEGRPGFTFTDFPTPRGLLPALAAARAAAAAPVPALGGV